MRALNQLSPQNQQIIISLIRQLAQTEGINVAISPSILTTPAEGIPLWIADLKSRGYSPRTIDTYAQSARTYLAHDPAPTTLSIKRYMAGRLGEVSPTRINCERKALKSLYAYLVDAGLWDFDPTARIRSIPIRHRERELPTREDIEKLLNTHTYRSSDEVKFKLILVLLLDCGLRISEAASIRKANIDFDRLEIKVRGKGDRERTVPVSPTTTELLKVYISQDGKSEWLFPGNNKLGYLDIRSYEHSMRRVCRRLGIKPISPHQLRHAFATYSLKAGARLEVISKLLGHSSIATTADIYTHWSREDLRREHERYGWFRQQPIMIEGGK